MRISQLITDLVLLRSGVDAETPVTELLPELRGESNTKWESITLEALADHLSGIGPTYGFPEIYSLIPLWESLGFPPVNKSDFPPCGVEGLNHGCTEQQLLSGLKKTHPVTPPNYRASYSTISFSVLSYAMQKATGKSFDDLLEENVLKPFNLTGTGAHPSNTSNAVIPNVQPNSWGIDYGDQAPGGGMRSSVNDICKIMHAALSYTALSEPAASRKWLQPTAFGTTPSFLVGEPWEIHRTTNLTPAHPHTIDIHAKDGAALAYAARMAVIDQYGIGLTILSAGGIGNEALNPITDAILATVVPAVEDAAREHAQKYTGKYHVSKGLLSPYQDEPEVPASIVLEIDDGPGLHVQSLTRNNTDILSAIQTIWNAQLVSPGVLNTDFRMYPMGIEECTTQEVNGQNISVVKEDWRMIIGPRPLPLKSDLPTTSEEPFNSDCYAFQSVDTIYYGGQAVDRFVFSRDQSTGRILSIDSPALRLLLGK